MTSARTRAIGAACGAAALFGVTTPLAKLLLDSMSPILLAALLYLGAGIGVTIHRHIRGVRGGGPSQAERKLVLGAVLVGGVLAPVSQLIGLAHMSSAGAALLLNAEAVLTVLLARVAFGEHIGRRVAVGMTLVVLGVAALTFEPSASFSLGWAPLSVLAACLFWALDNNLTRKAASADASWLASAKGFGAGITNTLLCLVVGVQWPSLPFVVAALLLGALGYGISLTLFVYALRALGAARTSGYFAIAPFLGAAVSLLLGSTVPKWFWLGALLMSIGVFLHLTEHHDHEHGHGNDVPAHEHAHFPDAEHWHEH